MIDAAEARGMSLEEYLAKHTIRQHRIIVARNRMRATELTKAEWYAMRVAQAALRAGGINVKLSELKLELNHGETPTRSSFARGTEAPPPSESVIPPPPIVTKDDIVAMGKKIWQTRTTPPGPKDRLANGRGRARRRMR